MIKRTVKSVIAGILMLLNASAAGQYPAIFNAPKGVYILLDTTWHKGTVINIERGETASAITLLETIPVPSDAKSFAGKLLSAEKDLPLTPASDGPTASTWWEGLNQSPSMPVFLMNPAGLIAVGVGYYDKTVEKGKHYFYRIRVKSPDGSVLNERTTGDFLYTADEQLPKPGFMFAKEQLERISLNWAYVPKKQPGNIKLFRRNEGENAFNEIPFTGGYQVKGDSVIITLTDTLVKPMSVNRYYMQAYDWLGNAFPLSDTAEARAYSPISAPMIRMLSTTALPGKHAIRLSWPALNAKWVKGIVVFRSKSMGGKYFPVATLCASDTSFTDNVPRFNENYWYFAVVVNRFGNGMPSTRVFETVPGSSVPLQPGQPVLTSVSNSVMISWKRPGGIITGYYVYRGYGFHDTLQQLSTLIPSDSLHFRDTTAVPGNAYRYSVAAVGEGNGLSLPSDPSTIQLPSNGKVSVPGDLSYRNEGSRIILFWSNLLLKDGQVGGYNVYRRSEGEPGFKKLTQKPLSPFSNTYSDTLFTRGKTQEYAISSVDTKGVEGSRSPFMKIGTELPERDPLEGISAYNTAGGGVLIKWPVLADPTVTGYKIFRFTGTEEPVCIGKSEKTSASYTDSSPVKGNQMSNYFVKAVYSDGYETEPGDITAIKLP